MAKKNNSSPFVYSTDPNSAPKFEEEAVETLVPAEQILKIIFETKHRAGKTVTIVYGFEGRDEDLESLSKSLKNHCGTGGSVKDGEIIIQGDHRQKILQFLQKNGYKKVKL